MKKLTQIFALTSLLTATHSFAEDNANIKAAIQKNYPATTVSAVKNTPIKGVYEVVMGQNIAYTDKTARYFIFGSLFDMKTQTDMSVTPQIDKKAVGFPSQERLRDALKTVVGKGERKLVVFSDPDCPYCQQLERNLLAVDNVTIYTFLYPLESIHPTAKSKSISIWCSENAPKAYHDYIISGVDPQMKTCETPIDRNIEYGASMGVNGTPTMIFEDGSMSAGALSVADIEKALQQAKTAKK